jgi:hypothetical protein
VPAVPALERSLSETMEPSQGRTEAWCQCSGQVAEQCAPVPRATLCCEPCTCDEDVSCKNHLNAPLSESP